MPAVILVIDDDPLFPIAVRAHVQQEVLYANSPKEGLELKSKGDVILCDFFMPGVDGLTYINVLKAMGKHVIGVSGQNLERCKELGLMSKDDMPAILAAIRKVI